jgi:CHAT domain-containing protein/tetratricopeptide (TPR) repeat protein
MGLTKLGFLSTLSALACILAAGSGAQPSEPPEPQPSPELRAVLEGAFGASFVPAQAPVYLERLQGLEAKALASGPVDRATLHRLRAVLLYAIGSREGSVAECRAAAAAWKEVPDGPGQVEALALAAAQEYEARADEGRRLVAEPIALARAETRRPRAAEAALNGAAQIVLSLGPLAPALADPDAFKPEFLSPGAVPPGVARPAVLLFEAAATLLLERDPTSRLAIDRLDSASMAAYLGGDLPGALSFSERALPLEEQLRPPSAVVLRLFFLGKCARTMGDFARSRGYFSRALALQNQKRLGPLAEADTRVQLALLCVAEGDASRAREELLEARRLRAEGRADALTQGESLMNLGLVAALQGDPDGAEGYGLQALQLLDTVRLAPSERLRRHSLAVLRAAVLNNLGLAAMSVSRWDDAQRWLEETLRLRQTEAPDSVEVAVALTNLGTLDLTRAQPDQAASYFQQALQIYRRPGGDAAGEALCLTNLGLTALARRDPKAAARSLEEARSLQEKRAPRSSQLALILHNLALARYLAGNRAGALRLEEEAWRIVTRHPAMPAEARGLEPSVSTQPLLAGTLALYRYLAGKPAQAFEVVEEGRVRGLQRLMGERGALLKAAAGAAWGRYERHLAVVQVASERLARAVNAERSAREVLPALADPAVPERRTSAEALVALRVEETRAARSAYVQLLDERARLAAGVERAAPRVFPRPLGLREAAEALPAGALALCFSVGEHDTLLFLLQRPPGAGQPPGLSAVRIRVSAAELKRAVAELRDAVTAPGMERGAATAAGRHLFARLFPGTAGAQVKAAKRLLVVPDAALWEAPFAALVTNGGDRPRYLGGVPITYAQSLTMLREFRRTARVPASSRGTALAVGNPRFAAPAGGEPGYLLGSDPPVPLPGTQAESAAIARLYGSTPLTGAAATEAEVGRRMAGADVVHLATHGFLRPGRPMSSGILLAPPQGPPSGTALDRANDGVLQAWEVFSEVKLRGRLVVLSACETARGGASPGDGIVGLTRALQFAGARSVIAGQWRVPDAGTATLMVELHRKLRAGVPRDRALAAAMTALRKRRGTAHPYHWAPFILVGDPDDAPRSRPGRR